MPGMRGISGMPGRYASHARNASHARHQACMACHTLACRTGLAFQKCCPFEPTGPLTPLGPGAHWALGSIIQKARVVWAQQGSFNDDSSLLRYMYAACPCVSGSLHLRQSFGVCGNASSSAGVTSLCNTATTLEQSTIQSPTPSHSRSCLLTIFTSVFARTPQTMLHTTRHNNCHPAQTNYMEAILVMLPCRQHQRKYQLPSSVTFPMPNAAYSSPVPLKSPPCQSEAHPTPSPKSPKP